MSGLIKNINDKEINETGSATNNKGSFLTILIFFLIYVPRKVAVFIDAKAKFNLELILA